MEAQLGLSVAQWGGPCANEKEADGANVLAVRGNVGEGKTI